MSEAIDTLKELGAQRIHKDTHISKEYAQAIIHESFDGINSVQFIGFISILEREYNIDLSELKAKGQAYFEEENANSSKEPKKVFVVPKRKKSYVKLYIALVVLIFLSFLYYIFVYLASTTQTVTQLDNTKINNAQKSITQTLDANSIAVDINETNSSSTEIILDTNATKKDIQVEVKAQVQEERTFKLVPKNKIWAGYINIKTNQKYQKIFRKTFVFDTTKDWLLLFGAGTVKLEINGEIKKFSSKQNLRFKYVDGELTKITIEEFKSLNKGRKW